MSENILKILAVLVPDLGNSKTFNEIMNPQPSALYQIPEFDRILAKRHDVLDVA